MTVAAPSRRPNWRQRSAIKPTLDSRASLRVLQAIGEARPRIAPPLPKRSRIGDLREVATNIGRPLLEWQDVAGRYIMAERQGKWLYPEVCVVVARQNGKSYILLSRIVEGLIRGERIMHTAQNRQLPQEVFRLVVGIILDFYPMLIKGKPRLANGQEAIYMKNGGVYRIVASNTMGARGYSNDLVIVDELLAMNDFDFVASARPTLTASRKPQMLYLSNAGDEASVVLNALRDRASSDDRLAYLEWSARPERAVDDTKGWAEANPALGAHITFEALQTAFRQLPSTKFETEHLCRWVTTMLPPVVSDMLWQRGKVGTGEPRRPSIAIAQDPAGRRASAAMAWRDGEDICAQLLVDFDGAPVDLKGVADRVQPMVRKYGVRSLGFDPWTDRDFARHFKDPKPIQGADYEAACRTFVELVEAGRLHYADEDGVLTADMANTVRKDTAHAWMAVRASDERATTSSFALIRAVWLATVPQPSAPQVY